MKQQIQYLLNNGYMTRQALAVALNVTDGGNIPALARKLGIAEIQVPMKGSKRCRRLYWRSDVERAVRRKDRAAAEFPDPKFGVLRLRPKQTALDLDVIESEVDSKKWRAGVDAKLSRILAELGEIRSYFEEADRMEVKNGC